MKARVTQNFEGTINGYVIFDSQRFINMLNIMRWLEERYLYDLKMRDALESFEFVEYLFDTISSLNMKTVSPNDVVRQLREEIALCYRYKDGRVNTVLNLNDEFINYLMNL
jgi:hypothetical protein